MQRINNPPRSRSYRNGRRGGRNPQESDAIVLALTAQIIVCLVLLLAAGVLKRADPQDYIQVKSQYTTMTTDESQNQQLADLIVEWSDQGGVLAYLEKAMNFLLEKVTGGGDQQYIDNALPVQIIGGQQASKYSFDYIGSASREGGAGGLFPVTVAGEQLEAPEGTTLAPIYLNTKIIPPVEGVITSNFAYRYHPISNETDFHNGMDIAAAEGTGILAALPGEVVEVGWSDIYGNYIIMQHATHLQTFYAHCSEIIAQEGMAVRQGERIAKVGQTGVATGPHLHFSVIVDGQYTNPAWVLDGHIQLVE